MATYVSSTLSLSHSFCWSSNNINLFHLSVVGINAKIRDGHLKTEKRKLHTREADVLVKCNLLSIYFTKHNVLKK